MTHRALRSLVEELRADLGSPARVLEAFARVAFDRRNLPPDPAWARSPRLARPDCSELFACDDVLGAAYQAINAPALEAAYRATARDRRKFMDDEVPAVTGLFTPGWIADWLVQNTLGVQLGRSSRTAPSLAPVPRGEGGGEGLKKSHDDACAMKRSPLAVVRPSSSELSAAPSPQPSPPSTGERGQRVPPVRDLRVRNLRVLDPACGTMNLGLAAVDLLWDRYREEIDRAGRPGWPAEPSVGDEREIAPAILRHNLHGVDVDPTALWLARLSLAMKLSVAHDATAMNLSKGDALFRRMRRSFDVVITNPPYLSARNLPAGVVARLKKVYPLAWRDLYACFIQRCLHLCRPGGRAGMLTMQSFMFTGAFTGLRRHIDAHAAIETILHLGAGVFPDGNPGTLQTVAFTLRREPDAEARGTQTVTAIRLVDAADKELALRSGAGPISEVRQADLARLPRGAWVYWTTPQICRLFTGFPTLKDVAPPRQGLATTQNRRFVRHWWEVEPTRPDAPCRATPGRWFPYAKSGRFRRWYESPRHRVNWEDDGREIKAEIVRRYPYLKGEWKWVAKNANWYGRPGGITYSYLTSGRFSARRLEPGSIFDVAGSSLFPPECPLTLLAVLNSSVASHLLGVINPTVNFQVGDLAELPVPPAHSDPLRTLAAEAIELQRQLDTFDETAPNFLRPPTPREGGEAIRSLQTRLAAVEQAVDEVVASLYGIEVSPVDRELPTRHPADFARRCVSFAIGRTFGRWGGQAGGDAVLQLRPAPTALITRLRHELAALGGPAIVDEIEAALSGIRDFLERDFFSWHVRLFARRPVYWAFGDRRRTFLLPHDCAHPSAVAPVLRRLGASLPAGWRRDVDAGVQQNLAPLAGWLPDASLRSRLLAAVPDLRPEVRA